MAPPPLTAGFDPVRVAIGKKILDKCDCANKCDSRSFSTRARLFEACLGTIVKLVSAGESSSLSELVEVFDVESPSLWLHANSESGEADRVGGVQM